jgi:hypothetical protein
LVTSSLDHWLHHWWLTHFILGHWRWAPIGLNISNGLLPCNGKARRFKSNSNQESTFLVANNALSYESVMSDRTNWETPRWKYDEYSCKFSLSMKPKFNRLAGERNHFWRLLLADFGKAPENNLVCGWRCQQQRGTCTQHNQATLPQLTVRLSISPVCWKQRIRCIVCKEIFVCGEVK